MLCRCLFSCSNCEHTIIVSKFGCTLRKLKCNLGKAVTPAAMGYPSSISGYKFYINTFDFDMGNPRGIKTGELEKYKFG